MKTRALVTGAGGFIGSHLLQHLLENTDWQIVCTDSWAHMGTPERLEQVLSKDPAWRERVEVITHDLSVLFPERTKKRIGQCKFIFNVASDSHVERSIEDPVPFVRNNVNLMLTMLEFAREYPPEMFLQISTDEVYGVAPGDTEHPEWDPIVPSNPYSASKAAQEALCIAYWRTFGVPVVITNTMNNYGEMQDPEKYLALIIRRLSQNQEVTVHGQGDRIGSRFYLHARNHADALLFIATKTTATKYVPEQELRPDRYNVVGDREMSNLEIAEMMATMMGKPLSYIVTDFHSTRPGHDMRYGLDGSKLKALGWTPPIELESSLAKYILWTLKNPIWL